jgi:hypothetical protein
LLLTEVEQVAVGVAGFEAVAEAVLGVVGIWAILATTSRNIFPTKGVDCRKAGRCAHAHSGRVVVDSQSIMQVYREI